MRTFAISMVLFTLVTVGLIGCGGGKVGGGGGAPALLPDGTGAEPTGGQFQTVVLASGASVAVPAPPADTSAQTQAELAELRTLQFQRVSPVLETARKQLTPPQSAATVAFWNTGAVVRWNEIARTLVIRNGTPPPLASRVYASLSVAQYDALVVAYRNKYLYGRPAPRELDRGLIPLVQTASDPVYPSEHATVAGASAAVLTGLFPGEASFLAGRVVEHEDSRLFAGVNFRSDLTAGDALGRAVAQQVLARAATDGAAVAGTQVPIPTTPGAWTGVNPVLPGWGAVRPWLMTAGSQFRPAPPPAFGGPEFTAALQEVRRISDTRTAEQLRIAQFWADGAGTFTPPGHWNQIGSDLLVARGFNELRAARALALMNMAVMDAGISCWDAKYFYWLLRPSMADPAITLPVGLPNFPTYTSGHSSFSGAAADVLGYIFPDQLNSMRAMSDEAAVSRLYGGIHFRFDNDAGLVTGRSIAQLAIARGRADGAP